MDELGKELAGALERGRGGGSPEQDLRRARRRRSTSTRCSPGPLEAAGALPGADAALLMLPDPQGGKPLVATLGLSVEEGGAPRNHAGRRRPARPLDHDVVHLSGASTRQATEREDGIVQSKMIITAALVAVRARALAGQGLVEG